MLDHQKFVLLLGRLVELLLRSSGAVDDHKATLRSLVDATSRNSATLRLTGGVLAVEGTPIPREVPFAATLIGQMQLHGVAEIHIAQSASPLDLVQLASALAVPKGAYAPGDGVEQRLKETQSTSVFVISAAREAAARERRAVRVTDALRMTGLVEGGTRGSQPLDVVQSSEGAAYVEMIEHKQAESSPLAGAAKRLRREPGGAGVAETLQAIAAGVQDAVRDKRLEEAVEAIVTVIRYEGTIEDPEGRRKYGVGMSRILTGEVLKAVAHLLLDQLYARDVMEIMQRAGSTGTQYLLELLVNARTFAERRSLLDALRNITDGTEMVVNLLRHKDWFVVRNVADLAGELKIEEAVPDLANAAEHSDNRVRKAAALALAKIGTPACAQPMRKVLRDPDPQMRTDIIKAIAGRGLGALAMPLVSDAENEKDPRIRLELYMALGRIGTPDAVQALKRVAAPSGNIMRRGPSEPRIGAIAGLALAGGDAALAALRELAQDKDSDVRKAAEQAFEAAQARARGSRNVNNQTVSGHLNLKK